MNLLHQAHVWWRARRLRRHKAWRRSLVRMFVGAAPESDTRNWSGEFIHSIQSQRSRR